MMSKFKSFFSQQSQSPEPGSNEPEIIDETSSPSIFKIPLKKETENVGCCNFFSYGESQIGKPNRTILVLGATGAGKSTLINGMINYILGVEWGDSSRFKLVHETSKSQAESQTTEVTVYKINHQEEFKINYSLTIIDTPGFGDKDTDENREITEQLLNLLTDEDGVTEIDAVCFVAQASSVRLTPTRKYVFDSVLPFYGNNIAENIRVLVTFADCQQPPVLEAIKTAGVPCPKTDDGLPCHFKFNNSALFADNQKKGADSLSGDDDDVGGFDKMFWNLGMKSMKRFFVALNTMKTKSLVLTKEVLRERKTLENLVKNLQEQVKIGLAKLEEIKEKFEKIQKFEAEIRRDKKFEIEVTVRKRVQVDVSGSGRYVTNCQQCHYTCHDDCGIPDDKDKHMCIALGSEGHCTACPDKCIWSQHFNQKYKWEYRKVTEKKTVTELKKKYNIAKDAQSPVEELLTKLKAEYEAVKAEVKELIKQYGKCLNRLNEIALRPNYLCCNRQRSCIRAQERRGARSSRKK